ncbi:MAG: ATP-dependent helicase, partial [Acidobacteria bacterium]|nr:ATP-dependent helicase [Acidobacteriota bacterium]
GKDSVLVTSFSRTAAQELAGRDLPLNTDRIGTLHSHCWHALGGPEIAETQVEEWNRTNPHLHIAPAQRSRRLDGDDAAEDTAERERDGSYWLRELNRYRGLMLPPAAWPNTLREFAAKWGDYKSSLGLLDFTDLIETALHDVSAAPGMPSVIFVDEAQDLNRLQLALIRKWGEHAQYFILAADDDQTVYSWCGATPDAVLDPEIPEDHKIILRQSYRVPREVHAAAQTLIRQVTRRQEKAYLPRPADGLCLRLSHGGYKSADYWILKTAVEHLERNHTVMFLGSCAYMLQPVIAVLRKNGIPYHNPYRKAEGFWNPLRFGRKGSAANRILALLVAHPDYGEHHREWHHGDLKLWTEWLNARGILRHGAKAQLDRSDPEQPVTIEALDALFEPAALETLLSDFDGDYRRLLEWWRGHIAARFHSRIQFPVEVAWLRGPQALVEKPKVIVGTIHSVKGGEADVVFLFPDLSRAGDVAYNNFGPIRDSVIRLFYVGMTRARETLYICQRESPLAVSI